jgi:endonuclease/exonuclease/phosphatase family metal-dependent hydrolase
MIRYRLALRVLACAAALLAGAVDAAALGVATWNLQWLLDADTHAQWVAVCGRNGWPQDTASLPGAERAALAGLPYCDVHSGMVFPPARCRSARDGWPNAARYPDAHPCRDTADLATWPRYVEKLALLRAMFRRLDAAGVGLVALQEVGSAAAVAAILPSGWRVATTRELRGTPVIAQHVGVAWKRGVTVRDIAAVNTLADSGLPDHPLRPGLAFTVDVGGRPVRVLVVHLKAGCRSRDLDTPLTAKDAHLPAERQDAVSADCALLRYQLPALEDWIDANAARDFALLGDFNRTLLREPPADSPTWSTRVDGSSPASPVGPCTLTRDGNRVRADCPARTRAMFPELNDNEPPGAVLWRARFADAGRGGAIPKGSSGDCRIVGPHGELTHDGIDHLLISESLKRRLTPEALTMHAENYVDADGVALRATPEHAMPSDHCPHVVTWTVRR